MEKTATKKKKATRVRKTAPAPQGDFARDIYSATGKKQGSYTLPTEVFGLPWNESLVYQVTQAAQANARTPVAHTKTRGEVRGGGKKPWKQKGTGRARHGSTRSPIWVGGGVAHGPRNDKDYSQKVNKKMRAKALNVVLSRKAKDGAILLVDDLGITQPKTKDAHKVMAALSKIEGFTTMLSKKKNSSLVVLPEKNSPISKSFANFGNIFTLEARELNATLALTYAHIVFINPEQSIPVITQRTART
ncbi:MAG: 50S ribosomal protein L4 [Patescibacteria group bacterium]